MLRSLLNELIPSVAVDLGTANTVVYHKGRGIVLDEPSFIACKDGAASSKSFIAAGAAAKEMLGRAPDGVRVVGPIKNGVIANFGMAETMLRHFIHKTRRFHPIAPGRAVLCIPSSVTGVEKRAVLEAAEQAQLGKVHLVEEAMAGALGAGLPVLEACASMVVDIGGGTTDVVVLSLGGVVCSESIRTAGEVFDERIIDYMKQAHQLSVGHQSAERIKIMIGAARRTKSSATTIVKGRDIRDGLPRACEISEEEVVEAVQGPISEIIRTIKHVLEMTPPELASDITERGITMVGGGSLLRELDRVVAEETGVPVSLAEEPLSAVVRGCGKILEQFETYRHLTVEPTQCD